MMTCSDVCQRLAERLAKAGYKIDEDGSHDDVWKALEKCVILPKHGKVQVVMGLDQGVLDMLTVCHSDATAKRAVKRYDKALAIEREPDGHYEHPENNCWWREVRLTK